MILYFFRGSGDKVYQSVSLDKEKVKNADCILILTDHSNIDWKLLKEWTE